MTDGLGNNVLERDLPLAAAAFFSEVFSRVIDQNIPHQLSRERKKLCTVLPFDLLLVDKFQIDFVNECGRLECVIGTLATEQMSGKTTQLGIDNRQKFF